MIDERQEELASLYVLDLLEGAERADFEAALAGDSALQALVRDLRESSAALAHTAPGALPPFDLKQRVLQSIEQSSPGKVRQKTIPFPVIPWAIAASFALLGAWLAQLYVASRSETALARQQQQLAEINATSARQQLEAERIIAQRQLAMDNQQLAEAQQQITDVSRVALDNARKLAAAEKDADSATVRATQADAQIAAARKQIADLQAEADLAQLKIAALVAMTNNAPPAVAVAVWSSAKQEGVFQAEKLPAISADQKYELWVVEDPKKAPVSAGVLDVSPEGTVRATFKPTTPVSAAAVFAVSREKNDGARAHTKPAEVVMVIK